MIQNYLFQENIFDDFIQKAKTNLYDWYGNFRIGMISADTQHLNEINWESHCSTAATLNHCLEF